MMDGPLPPNLVPSWSRFLATPAHLTLDPSSGVCEALFSDPLLFPLQRKREMARMLKIASQINPRVIVELGADKAGSLLSWCLLPTVHRAIACEIRGTPYASNFDSAFPDIDFLWLAKSSYDPQTLREVSAWLGKRRIDVLFIDGDKSAFDKDLVAYTPMMAPGGIIFLHDINDPGNPRKTFERVMSGNLLAGRVESCEAIIDVTEVEPALAREAAGIPPASPHEGWLRWWRGKSCSVGVIRLKRGRDVDR